MQISSLNSTKIHSKLFWIFVSENQTQRQILTPVFFASASGNYETEHPSYTTNDLATSAAAVAKRTSSLRQRALTVKYATCGKNSSCLLGRISGRAASDERGRIVGGLYCGEESRWKMKQAVHRRFVDNDWRVFSVVVNWLIFVLVASPLVPPSQVPSLLILISFSRIYALDACMQSTGYRRTGQSVCQEDALLCSATITNSVTTSLQTVR